MRFEQKAMDLYHTNPWPRRDIFRCGEKGKRDITLMTEGSWVACWSEQKGQLVYEFLPAGDNQSLFPILWGLSIEDLKNHGKEISWKS